MASLCFSWSLPATPISSSSGQRNLLFRQLKKKGSKEKSSNSCIFYTNGIIKKIKGFQSQSQHCRWGLIPILLHDVSFSNSIEEAALKCVVWSFISNLQSVKCCSCGATLWDIYWICFWSFSQELVCYSEPRPSPLFTTQRYWSHYEIQINILRIKVPGLQQIGIYSLES